MNLNIPEALTNELTIQYLLLSRAADEATSRIISPSTTRGRVNFLTGRGAMPASTPQVRASMSGSGSGSFTVTAEGDSAINVSFNVDTGDILNLLQAFSGSAGTDARYSTGDIIYLSNRAGGENSNTAPVVSYTNAIGINWQKTCFVHPRAIDGVTLLNDFFTSYQPVQWLKLKFGFTHVYMEMWDDTIVSTQGIYPNYISSSAGYDTSVKTGYSNGKINQTAPYLGVEYTCTIGPSFTLGAGFGSTIFLPENLRFKQTFTLYSAAKNESETGDTANRTMVLTQTFDTAAMLRLEIKPRYYISPRAVIGLYIAATYTTPLRVTRAELENGIALDPHTTTDTDSTLPGFRATQMGVKKNYDVEDDLKLAGCAMNLSASFYF